MSLEELLAFTVVATVGVERLLLAVLASEVVPSRARRSDLLAEKSAVLPFGVRFLLGGRLRLVESPSSACITAVVFVRFSPLLLGWK